jgi:hypothetical protein
MNKKQKILTVIALAVFAGIIAGHYSSPNGRYGFYRSDYGWYYLDLSASGKYGFIPDVRLPIFTLAVFYAGLFFILRGKDTDSVPRRPRDWRRIKRVILIISVIAAGLVVIGGFSAAVIQSYEYQRQQERERDAYIGDEASKHRIKASEIELSDLRMSTGSYNSFINGRIKNHSRQELTSVTLRVSVYEKGTTDKPWRDIVGEATLKINVTVPPHQSRAISESVYFKDLPKLERNRWTWGYFITEIRGSKAGTWLDDSIVKDFDPDKYLGLTPTPSPK